MPLKKSEQQIRFIGFIRFSECVGVLPAIVGKGHMALTEPRSMIFMDPKEKQCSSSWLTDNTRAVPKSVYGGDGWCLH